MGGSGATTEGGPTHERVLSGRGGNATTTHALDPEDIATLVRESRLAQGLSARITDASVLARMAVLVKAR